MTILIYDKLNKALFEDTTKLNGVAFSLQPDVALNKEMLNHLNCQIGDYINMVLLRDGSININKINDQKNDHDIDMSLINDLLIKVKLDDID